MSEPDAAVGDEGPETDALLATRRWLVVVSSAIAGGLTLLIGLSIYPRLSLTEHVLMGLAAALLMVALVRSRQHGYLWLAVAGLLTLALAAVLVPSGPLRWVPLNVLITYSTLYVIMLSPRILGLLAAFGAAAALMVIWSRRPTNVIVANLALLGGWIAVLQVVLASLLVWWSWHRLRARAAVSDAALREVQERTAASVRLQERARLWRVTAARLHESILNSIRYVLTAPEVDRARLAAEVEGDREPLPATGSSRGTSLPTLVQELKADAAHGGVVSIVGWIPDVGLDRDVFDAVRAGAVELVRNAARHGGATTVTVGAEMDGDGKVVLRLEDDGEGAGDSGDPSVGRTMVLGSSLDEVGAHWSRHLSASGGGVSEIRFPASGDRRQRDHEPDRAFDSGRVIVTSALAGIVAGGALFYVHMVIVGPVALRLAGALGLVGAVVAVTVALRKQRIHPSIGLALVLAPAMVPWFLLGDQYTCREAAPLSPVLNTAGYAIMIIAAWSGRLPGVVGLLIWAVSGGLLVQSIPEGCRDSASVALLNSLVALPVIIAVTYAGARAHRRAQDAARATRQQEIVERSTADAALAINRQLDASVRDAQATLVAVANGMEVDGAARERLMQLDGRIRVGIQVDPQTDGSVAVMAKSLVDVVGAQGRSVSVRAITCSPDRRPLPAEVQGALFLILMQQTPTPPRLRVFTDGEEDHLALVTSASALGTSGLRPGDERRFDDVFLEIEDAGDSDDGRIAILVSRPISMSTVHA